MRFSIRRGSQTGGCKFKWDKADEVYGNDKTSGGLIAFSVHVRHPRCFPHFFAKWSATITLSDGETLELLNKVTHIDSSDPSLNNTEFRGWLPNDCVANLNYSVEVRHADRFGFGQELIKRWPSAGGHEREIQRPAINPVVLDRYTGQPPGAPVGVHYPVALMVHRGENRCGDSVEGQNVGWASLDNNGEVKISEATGVLSLLVSEHPASFEATSEIGRSVFAVQETPGGIAPTVASIMIAGKHITGVLDCESITQEVFISDTGCWLVASGGYADSQYQCELAITFKQSFTTPECQYGCDHQNEIKWCGQSGRIELSGAGDTPCDTKFCVFVRKN
jgi:hypothetical protein